MTDERPAVHRAHLPAPFVLLLAMALGTWFNHWWPIRIGVSWLVPLAYLNASVALVLGVWALVEFRRAKTPANPMKLTTALITTGPYRFSRNPMYLAMVLAMVSVGLVIPNWWMVLLSIPIVWVLTRFDIRPEERYLADKFAEAYTDYARRVRRWI